MLNNSKLINNSEFINADSLSQLNSKFQIKQPKINNISFKNSLQLIKSEQKENAHRQYLIDFIRDNNNKNKKTSNQKIIPKKNGITAIKEEQEESQKEKQNKELIDPKNFFNDYFYNQKKKERIEYNKRNSNQNFIDIIDYIGEDAIYPIGIDIMNIKMENFIAGKISTKSFGLINSYGVNTNQGIDRNYNDDRVKILINMNRPNNYINKSAWPLISFFGIFDGHNGDHCAEFLRKNLLQYIYTNPNFPKNIEKAIKEGFIKADQDYLNNYTVLNKTNFNSFNIINNSGSCGLILLLVDTKIYIANVGDSRCLISCQNGKIQKDVTRDHKPEFPYEKQRIYSHGGNIYQNETVFTDEVKKERNYNISCNKILLGPYRVNPGKLSVSRTIGDAKAKLERYGGIPQTIIPEPDVYVFDFYEDDIDYFIMCCDGIFDRIKSFEIFKCVETIVDKEKEMLENNIKYNNEFNTLYERKINMNTTCGNIVDLILRLSMIRKSYDNVTCMMVAFKDLISGINLNNKENNTLTKSYDKNNSKLIKMKYSNYNNRSISKDIHIKKTDNENRKNISQEANRRFYKKLDVNSINNSLNMKKLKKNFLNREKVNNIDENENNKENEILNQNQNNKKIQSQSQEKKIRELITLFSINNKKRQDNDNTSFLYNTYNSKNKEINNNTSLNKTQKTIYKNNIVFKSTNLSNNNNKNISLLGKEKEKINSLNKSVTVINDQLKKSENIIYNLKRYDYNKNKSSYYNLKNYPENSPIFGTNSFLEEDENENANRNKEEKSYIQNNPKNKIKSENIFATPNKTNDYNQRITSRKIVRKTNNIFIQKNNKRDSINDEYNREISNINNNSKNNFFHSIILSSVKKGKDNDNYKNKNDDTISSRINKNSQVNIRKINYERYRVKNQRNNNSNIYSPEKESKINRYDKIVNSRYEKNSKFLNEKSSSSSSIAIIYTKKRKIK